jgi:hypothetical protein
MDERHLSKVTELETIRGEKAPRCDYCGEIEHQAVFACPRIKSVTYTDDDQVIVRLWGQRETQGMAGRG